jgi:hypothetical protein
MTDPDAFIHAWTQGYYARGLPITCPFDAGAQPVEYRAWMKGYQGAVLGVIECGIRPDCGP